ncbi:hypothetical protein [Rhizobium sp. LjRoot254]|uniref:hypothetical protein n=1 Tax=Rhizobium sp. LjRoot254 TaxID=3342297 RepID=UPI003ECF72F6
MHKVIKTTLLAVSILASASIGYAQQNPGLDGPGGFDGRKNLGVGETHGNEIENEELRTVDPAPTGSIVPCESGSYDVDGNCIIDPDMQ